MRALIRISWREVKEGFTKFLLTLLSVSLGVAFLTGTLALRDTLANTFNSIVTASITNDVYVRGQKITDNPGDNTRHSVPLELENDIRSVVGPDALIEPNMSVQNVTLEDANGKVISNSGAPTMLLPYYDNPLGSKLAEGRWPKGQREVAILSNALEPAGLKVGDTTEMTINGAKREVTITGSVDYERTTFGAVVLFMERDVVEPIALPDVKKVSNIGITLPEGMNTADAINQIAKVVPANTVVITSDVLKRESEEEIDTQLGFVNVFLLVFVFIALFVGSFVIANTFAMTVRQRMKQFAMLRAIGTKPGGIFFLVLVQAVVIGFLGSLLGLVLGNGLLLGVGALFQSLGLTLDTPTMSSQIMMIGIIVGILVTICGAFMSARKAALTNPLEVLRDAQGGERSTYTWRNFLGLGALVLGVILLIAGASAGDTTLIGIAAVLVIFGVLGALAFMAEPVINVGSKLLRPFGKAETNLAVGNILRNRSRTAATAGALLIGVALVAAGSMLSRSVEAGSTSVISNNLKSDLVVYATNGSYVPRDEITRIKDVDKVAGVSSMYINQAAVTFDGETTTQSILLVDTNMKDYRAETVIEGDADALADGKVVINRLRLPTDGKDKYKVGDELTYQTAYGKKVAKVGAIVEAPALNLTMILPATWINDLSPDLHDPFTIDVKVEDDADVQAVKQDINNLFDKDSEYKANDPEEINGQNGQQLNTILGVLYALIGLSVITAIVGIVNTLALSVMDRTREIGMSQAIGMRRREVLRMIVFEGLLTTLLGVVVGLITGLGLAWALISALASFGISTVVVPWGTIVAVVIGSIVIGVLASLIPARNASKINVLSAMAE